MHCSSEPGCCMWTYQTSVTQKQSLWVEYHSAFLLCKNLKNLVRSYELNSCCSLSSPQKNNPQTWWNCPGENQTHSIWMFPLPAYLSVCLCEDSEPKYVAHKILSRLKSTKKMLCMIFLFQQWNSFSTVGWNSYSVQSVLSLVFHQCLVHTLTTLTTKGLWVIR